MTADCNEPPSDPTQLEHEAYGWVVHFISGKANADDLAKLRQWSSRSPAHSAAFDQASRTWTALDGSNAAIARVAALEQAVAQRRMRRRAFIGGAMAASVTAAVAYAGARPPLGLWPSWSELAADYRTEPGEQRHIELADRVSVDMNTRTSVAVRANAQDVARIELISGEAMISVPGASAGITVLAGDGRVTASDARFNIRYDDQAVRVTCLSGVVRVECRAGDAPLAQGQQLAYSTRTIGAPVAIDPTATTAWKDGVIIFDATPISDVVAEINRYRRGRLILIDPALGHKRFNARFRLENIDSVVGRIAQVFGAKVTTLPGGIVLLG